MRAAWTLAAALSAAWLCEGCAKTCDTTGESVRYTQGHTDPTRTFYETGAFDEPFLDFPGGRRYEFVHGLLSPPHHIGIYLSFDPEPQKTHNNWSLAAGNEAVIEQVDAELVRIRNDTCSDFFVRVELWTFADDAGAPSDATADGG